MILLKYKAALETQLAEVQKQLLASQKDLLQERKKNQESDAKLEALEKMSRGFQEQLVAVMKENKELKKEGDVANKQV